MEILEKRHICNIKTLIVNSSQDFQMQLCANRPILDLQKQTDSIVQHGHAAKKSGSQMQRDTQANIQQENLGFPFTVASLNIIYLVSTHFLSTISITTVHDIRCTTLQFTSENTRQKEQPKLELFSIFYFKPQKWAKLDLSWAKEIFICYRFRHFAMFRTQWSR